jgi:adenosylcobinamide-GDP ribazoletransferase
VDAAVKSLLIALQFLTRLPVRLEDAPRPAEVGRSLLYYPLVGLCIGALLLSVAYVTAAIGGLLPAALTLTVWVLVTGALHLDGLADCADAWVGGHGDRQRTLAIMKDPYSGPVAVVVVVLVLLLKFAALQRVIGQGDWVALTLAPVLGRTAPLLLFLGTPYVRPGGLGAPLAEHPPCRAGWWVGVGVVLIAVLAAGARALWPLLAGVGVLLWLRAATLKRIGGFTGDVAGAGVELVECAALVGWVASA